MLTLGLAACASGPDGAPAPDPGAVPTRLPRVQDDGDTGPARDPSCPGDRAWVASVHARVLTPAGEPLAGAKVQLCVFTAPDDASGDDRVLCLQPSDADDNGDVIVDIADTARCMTRATARVLMPSSDRPAVYCPIDVDGDDASLTVPDPYVLVEATADASVVGAEGFAMAQLSRAELPACVAANAPALDVAFAFTPETDVDALLDLANPPALALGPGEHAALWVQGGLGCTRADGSFIDKGAWERVGDAVVDASGERIVADTALPCVNWAGLSTE